MMLNPLAQIVDECQAGDLDRRSVAMTYAFVLRQCPDVDRTAAHEAIAARFGAANLEWIKTRASAYHTGKIRMGSPRDRR